jgi:hypothetical protein
MIHSRKKNYFAELRRQFWQSAESAQRRTLHDVFIILGIAGEPLRETIRAVTLR